ncbi:unknown [Akkermansia muciniphila CAG:154]|nr:unknown [Akkermansia muciniphila CAG:154]
MPHFHRAAAQQDFSGKTGVVRGDGQGSAAGLLQLGASHQGTGPRPRITGCVSIDDDQARIHLPGDVHGLRRIACYVTEDDSVAVGKRQSRIPGGIPRSSHRPRIVSAARPGQGRDLRHDEFQGIVRRAPVADVFGPQQNGIGQIPGDAARGINQIVRARAPAHAVAVLQQQAAVHRQGAVQGQQGIAVHRHVSGVNPHGRSQVQVAGHRILPPKGQDAGGHGQAGIAVHGGDVQARSRGQGKAAVPRGNAADGRIPRYGKVLVRSHSGGMADNEGAPFQFHAAREGRGMGQGQRPGTVLDQPACPPEHIVAGRGHIPGPGQRQGAVQLNPLGGRYRHAHGAGGILHLHGAAPRRYRQAAPEFSVFLLGKLQAPFVVQGPVIRIGGHLTQTIIGIFPHAQHAAVGHGHTATGIPPRVKTGVRSAQIQRSVINSQCFGDWITPDFLRSRRFNPENAAAGDGEAVIANIERSLRLGQRLSGFNGQGQTVRSDGRRLIPSGISTNGYITCKRLGRGCQNCNGIAGEYCGQQSDGQMKLHKK